MSTLTGRTREEPCPRCGSLEQVINGLWLRSKRIKAGITLREFARRLDLSAPYISDIETNRRTVTPAILKAYESL